MTKSVKFMTNLTYSKSGVDIDAYERAKDEFAKIIKATNEKSQFVDCVVAGLGSFGAVFDTKKAASKLGIKNYADVESIDSVGTKVKIAALLERYDSVGLDMIGHSTGDILAQGAIPTVFGDYIAVPEVKEKMVVELVAGVAKGCEDSGMILHFGEVAELPGVYHKDKFDLVGSIRGIVDLDNVITGSDIVSGDVLIGIASSGLHTNGFSLVNKLFFEIKNYKISDNIPELGKTLGEELMIPHRNFTKPLAELFPKKIIKGIAHITGGGLPDNVIRILPEGTEAHIKLGSWETLPIFDYIQKLGQIEDKEMRRTFNMGLGMVLVSAGENVDAIKEVFEKSKIKTFEIGEMVEGERGVEFVR